jgi:RNA polymerase sigma-70 factor (ECF subfamily)
VSSSDPDSILARLQRGDPAAFDEIYAAEKAGLYGFLLRLSRDPHAAADLFQNVWLKLARNAASLRADSNVRAWLYTVARHEYVSLRRAQALDLSRLLLLGIEVPEPACDAALETQLLALKTACAALGDADREVLLLCSAEGLDSQAVAQVLGISNAAVRQRLVRARRRLAALLAQDASQQAQDALDKGAR